MSALHNFILLSFGHKVCLIRPQKSIAKENKLNGNECQLVFDVLRV